MKPLALHSHIVSELVRDDSHGALQPAGGAVDDDFDDYGDLDEDGDLDLAVDLRRRGTGCGLACLAKGLGTEVVLLLLVRAHMLALRQQRAEYRRRMQSSLFENTNRTGQSASQAEAVGCVVVLGVPDELRDLIFERLWDLQESVIAGEGGEDDDGGGGGGEEEEDMLFEPERKRPRTLPPREGESPSLSAVLPQKQGGGDDGGPPARMQRRRGGGFGRASGNLVPLVVTGDMSENERRAAYRTGSVLFCATQILLMDALFERVTAPQCAGVVLWRPELVTEHSPIAFALRILRAGKQRVRQAAMWKRSRELQMDAQLPPSQRKFKGNKASWSQHTVRGAYLSQEISELEDARLPQALFVQAISEDPSRLLRGGFNAVAKLLRTLGIPADRLFLWPRFRDVVKTALEHRPSTMRDPDGHSTAGMELIELRVPMSPHMIGIQHAIVQVAASIFAELESSRALTDTTGLFQTGNLGSSSEFAVPSSMLSPDFASRVLSELRPQWDRLGATARHMAYDIRALRRLLFAASDYDAVHFWREVRRVARDSGQLGVWNLSDHAPQVLSLARQRVLSDVFENEETCKPVDGSENEESELPKAPNDEDDYVTFDIDAEYPVEMDEGPAAPEDDDLDLSTDTTELNGQGEDSMWEPPRVIDEFGGKNVRLVLEAQPKWRVLMQTLDEIGAEKWLSPTVVLVRSSATQDQVSRLLSTEGANSDHQAFNFLQKRWKVVRRTEAQRAKTSSAVAAANEANMTGTHFRWQPRPKVAQEPLGQAADLKGEEPADRNVDAPPEDSDSEGEGDGDDDEGVQMPIEPEFGVALDEPVPEPVPVRVQDGNDRNGANLGQDVIDVDALDDEWGFIGDGRQQVIVFAYGTGSNPNLDALLLELQPRAVVVYDSDLGVFRKLERFAQSFAVRLYWMTYLEGVDMQHYKHAQQQEFNAFKDLIKERAIVIRPTLAAQQLQTTADAGFAPNQVLDLPPIPDSAMPVSRQSGTSASSSLFAVSFSGRKIKSHPGKALVDPALRDEKQPRIVVDSREFRSSLPSILFSEGFKLIPAAIEVSDYVLTPQCGVERKALADLIQSLSSGRLFTQARQLCTYFPHFPVLSVEFDASREPFRLSSEFQGDEISPRSLVSRMALLLLHFPKLRVFWCRSPAHAASIFKAVKRNAARLSISAGTYADAVLVGSASVDAGDDASSSTSVDAVQTASEQEDDPLAFWADSTNSEGPTSGTLPNAPSLSDADPLPKGGGRSSELEPSLDQLGIADGDVELDSQPVRILLQLPGVDRHNYKMVLSEVRNLHELSTLPKETLVRLLGKSNGALLHSFFRKQAPQTNPKTNSRRF